MILAFQDWIALHRDRDNYHGDFAARWLRQIDDWTDLGWIEELAERLEAAGCSPCELCALMELWQSWLAAKRAERKARGIRGRISFGKADAWRFACPRDRPQWSALHRRYGEAWRLQLFPMEPQDRPGCVYFLHAETGHYKIGKSSQVGPRLRTLEIQLPFKVDLVHSIRTDDCHELERQWHVRFAHLRGNGEWFSLKLPEVRFAQRFAEQILYWPPFSDYLDADYLPEEAFRSLRVGGSN